METTDHDLLVELRTEFRLFREEVRASNALYAPLELRVATVEKRADTFETALKVTRWIFAAAATALALVATLWATFWTNHR